MSPIDENTLAISYKRLIFAAYEKQNVRVLHKFAYNFHVFTIMKAHLKERLSYFS